MANRTEYKDSQGHLVGYIDIIQGNAHCWDASGKSLGKYDRITNKTMDSQGGIYGSGNMLTNFFTKDSTLK